MHDPVAATTSLILPSGSQCKKDIVHLSQDSLSSTPQNETNLAARCDDGASRVGRFYMTVQQQPLLSASPSISILPEGPLPPAAGAPEPYDDISLLYLLISLTRS